MTIKNSNFQVVNFSHYDIIIEVIIFTKVLLPDNYKFYLFRGGGHTERQPRTGDEPATSCRSFGLVTLACQSMSMIGDTNIQCNYLIS